MLFVKGSIYVELPSELIQSRYPHLSSLPPLGEFPRYPFDFPCTEEVDLIPIVYTPTP